jgi:ribokinase
MTNEAHDRFDVCVIGSANLDLVARTPRIPGPGETVLGTSYAEHAGGKGLNQAVAASRAGARTAFVGAVGDDAAGALLRSVLAGAAVESRAVRTTHEHPTGRALITVSDDAENSIVVVPGANGALTPPDELPPAAVVLAQLEVPVAVVLRAFTLARRAGARTVLNPAPARELPDDLLGLTDVIVPNEHELALLGGPDRLLAAGAGALVVTLGARGARIIVGGRPERAQPAFSVEAVDTTGAGDAFCGALGARLAAGDDIDAAVRWAAAAGALATTVAGAVPSLPSADAVAAVLSGAGPPPPIPPA